MAEESERRNSLNNDAEEKDRLNLLPNRIDDDDLDHFPPYLVDDYKHITILDLSFNRFSDFSFLRDFQNLTCLILDHNRVNSSTIFPPIPSLKVLYMNHNWISQLVPFVQRLDLSFPNLEHLSMMANVAVPYNIDDTTFYDYIQYRLFVISRMPHLTYLDDRSVSSHERKEARRLYKIPLLERVTKLTDNRVIFSVVKQCNEVAETCNNVIQNVRRFLNREGLP